MRCSFTGLFLVIFLGYTTAQLPPRLQIPGTLLTQARPVPFRQPRIQGDGPVPRLRRPIPNAIPIPLREVRPVVEEEEEPNPTQSSFDDEVNKLGISVLTSAVRDAVSEENTELRPSPLPFRPERPIPISRDNIRERPFQSLPPPRPVPIVRQEVQRPVPVLRQERPSVRQELREEIPVRAPVRQQTRQQSLPPPPPTQSYRPAAPARAAPRPQIYEDGEDLRERKKKPTVQILRKYRTDNADGSITWGYENEDGSFKEETLGIDCVTRGKYGYVDPDGVKREYSYETGNKCDEPEEEEQDLLPQRPNVPQPQGRKNQPQFRPQPQAQY